MEPKTLGGLVLLAIIVYILYLTVGKRGAPAFHNAVQQPVEAGGTPDTSQQTATSYFGFPLAQYSGGPSFYIANQPWFFDGGTNGVMPMTSASTNYSGAPSAQM